MAGKMWPGCCDCFFVTCLFAAGYIKIPIIELSVISVYMPSNKLEVGFEF